MSRADHNRPLSDLAARGERPGGGSSLFDSRRKAESLSPGLLRWTGLSLLLSLVALVERVPQAHGMGSLPGGWSGSRLLSLTPVLAVTLAAAGFAWLCWQRPEAAARAARAGYAGLRRLGRLNWVVFAALALAYPLARLTALSGTLDPLFPPLWLLGHLALLAALFLRAGWRGGSLDQSLALALTGFAALYQAALFLPDLSRYPLTLGWSETSRYYYASLFAAGKVYGQWFPLPTLHPTRYLLQSLPFLVPGLGLAAHRAWQVILWLALTGLGGYALARRLRLSRPALTLAAALWAFVFAFQGPVYYHLMACAILVLLGFDSRRLWRSLGVVLLASLWAGISRVNWFPMPGLIAAALYLMEQPAAGKKFWRYWLPPAIWVAAGMVAALAAQAVYAVISNNPLEQFSSSFSSDLLWYRLFPNVTYGPGILRAVLLAALPALGVILAVFLLRRRAFHWLRALALAAILAVLFAGGLVVSVKIGGGSNLHNMDAFLTVLMIVALYAAAGRIQPDRVDAAAPAWTSAAWARAAAWLWLAFALLAPIAPLARAPLALPRQDAAAASAGIRQLQAELDSVDGEVLFIANRHLVTFGYVHGVGMVPEYERVFLMEMAMAGNRPYLDAFHTDLKNHRFALIITQPEGEMIQDQSYAFSEENNVWVEQVARPLNAAYRQKALLGGQIQVLEPRP